MLNHFPNLRDLIRLGFDACRSTSERIVPTHAHPQSRLSGPWDNPKGPQSAALFEDEEKGAWRILFRVQASIELNSGALEERRNTPNNRLYLIERQP